MQKTVTLRTIKANHDQRVQSGRYGDKNNEVTATTTITTDSSVSFSSPSSTTSPSMPGTQTRHTTSSIRNACAATSTANACVAKSRVGDVIRWDSTKVQAAILTAAVSQRKDANKRKVILLIRHGQAEHNISMSKLYHIDTKLTSKGEHQVQQLHKFLTKESLFEEAGGKTQHSNSHGVQLVILSPLARAIQTGFGAFAAHVPTDGNIVLCFAPHVGIDSNGTIGKVLREG